MIGVVSHAGDLHAVDVRRHLDALGAEHLQLDTADVPTAACLTAVQEPGAPWSGSWTTAAGSLDLTALRAVWWRRPQPFALDDAVADPVDRHFALGECAALVSGLWSCVPATWVNDPDRDERASRKPLQLQLAARLGLRVPRTCMTSDPARAAAFLADEPGEVVYKSFSATPETWRHTRLVGAEERDALELVRLAPVVFQEAVAGTDVRVTVVDGAVFPARITPRGGYAYDFRVDADPLVEPCTLPAPVEQRLLRLVEELGLVYGAADFRATPEGEHVFLEVNPAGQWLFVELATGQPISAALADVLHRADVGCASMRG